MTSAQPYRPPTVLVAVVMTVVGAAVLAIGGLAMTIAASTAAFDGVVEASALPSSVPDSLVALAGLAALLIGVALAVLGRYALRGAHRARVALTALGVISIAIQGISIATGTQGAVLPMVWIGLAISLLWRHDASAWFRADRS